MAERLGFLTDITLCIGCKACEVACKQWNGLASEGFELTGASYDNTLALGPTSWRHVLFVEQSAAGSNASSGTAAAPTTLDSATAAGLRFDPTAWLLMSDVCKHCQRAGCMDACPTGAITRTEFDQVLVQPDICNGCGYCVPACPFGVIEIDRTIGIAQKCTLCYDRLKDGMEPACAKSCPTDSIQFGVVDDLRVRAERRVATLRASGYASARFYGGDDVAGGLNASFILTRDPETFNLPRAPRIPVDNVIPGSIATIVAAIGVGIALAATFLGRRGA
ncbi:MAG: 4Fe-4S dicluster domain-containing protein [Chloroflexota bacterium]|nr:MAG: 4Fe-4S dicluster domain-containing protein [Chloroflexota bacterium]